MSKILTLVAPPPSGFYEDDRTSCDGSRDTLTAGEEGRKDAVDRKVTRSFSAFTYSKPTLFPSQASATASRENCLGLERTLALHLRGAAWFVLIQDASMPRDKTLSPRHRNGSNHTGPVRGPSNSCQPWNGLTPGLKRKAIFLKHFTEAFFESDSFLVETLWHVWGSFFKCVYNKGLSPNVGGVKPALSVGEIIRTTRVNRQRRPSVCWRSRPTKQT